jgi:O-antigen/teichoic acid export membrane protein
MSLAWANLANLVATGLLFIPMRPAGLPWLPGFQRWRRVVKFGMGAMLTNAMNALNAALPDLLLGKLGSAHQVGLVSRANSTVSIFTYIAGGAINFGSLAYIARTHHQGESLVPVLTRGASLLTGVGWPALALTSLLGYELVDVLYGANWLECVPAIAPLALAAGVGLWFNYSGMALIAINRPYLAALPVAAAILARIFLATSFFSGDIASFAWVLLAATGFTIPCQLYLQTKFLGLSVARSCQSVLASLFVTVVCGVLCIGLLRVLSAHELGSLSKLLLTAALMAPVWLAAVLVSKHPITVELQILKKNILHWLSARGR